MTIFSVLCVSEHVGILTCIQLKPKPQMLLNDLLMRLMLLLLVVATVFCCTEPAESRFDKVARAYCECTGKLVDLNQQTAALATDSSAQVTFQENLRRIQDEYEKAKLCNATIVAQFGKLRTAELDSLKTILAKGNCPDLSRQDDLLKEMLGE